MTPLVELVCSSVSIFGGDAEEQQLGVGGDGGGCAGMGVVGAGQHKKKDRLQDRLRSEEQRKLEHRLAAAEAKAEEAEEKNNKIQAASKAAAAAAAAAKEEHSKEQRRHRFTVLQARVLAVLALVCVVWAVYASLRVRALLLVAKEQEQESVERGGPGVLLGEVRHRTARASYSVGGCGGKRYVFDAENNIWR